MNSRLVCFSCEPVINTNIIHGKLKLQCTMMVAQSRLLSKQPTQEMYWQSHLHSRKFFQVLNATSMKRLGGGTCFHLYHLNGFLKFISKIIHLLEGRFIGVVTLVNFKLLMFLERLVTAFKVALFRKLSCH